MALCAREILAIPTSEVDCERLFNKGRDLLGIRRYAISGETIRTMMLLKGALRSKRLNEQAQNLTLTSLNASSIVYHKDEISS
jgi:hypothetical protein